MLHSAGSPSPMASRSSAENLKPLPPDPDRHQHSAIPPPAPPQAVGCAPGERRVVRPPTGPGSRPQSGIAPQCARAPRRRSAPVRLSHASLLAVAPRGSWTTAPPLGRPRRPGRSWPGWLRSTRRLLSLPGRTPLVLVGYARVSTDDQNLTLQRTALKQAGCKRIYEEKVSA